MLRRPPPDPPQQYIQESIEQLSQADGPHWERIFFFLIEIKFTCDFVLNTGKEDYQLVVKASLGYVCYQRVGIDEDSQTQHICRKQSLRAGERRRETLPWGVALELPFCGLERGKRKPLSQQLEKIS